MNETLTRTISGAVYIAILISCSLYPNSFLLLFGLFMVIAVFEFSRMCQLNTALSISIGILLYTLFSPLWVTRQIQWALLGLTLLVSIRLLVWLFSTKPTYLFKSDKYVYLIGYVITPLIIISWIPFTTSGFKPWHFISICILIWTNDTFAYLTGKTFGKHKLLERISPKKTIEGFIGGWIMAVIFAIPVAIYINEEPIFKWMIIATICSFLGTLGDLVESKFKRFANIKDSGRIMPGHGGILDRLDSIIFVAPFVFLFHQIIQHVS